MLDDRTIPTVCKVIGGILEKLSWTNKPQKQLTTIKKFQTIMTDHKRPETLAEKIQSHSMGLQKHRQKQSAFEVEII